MVTFKSRTRLVALTALVCVWAALGYACSSGDENPAVDRGRGTGDGGGDGSGGSGGDGAPSGAALCGKYGGYENVKTMAATILQKTQADCRIGGAFADLDQGRKEHLLECFQIQLGNAFKCDGITYVGGQTKDSKGNECRTMSDAHSPNNMRDNRKLRDADYNAFVEAIAATFNAQPGANKDDLVSLEAFFVGQKANIVQSNNQPTANAYCPNDGTCPTCHPLDAGIIPDTGVDTGADTGAPPADAGDAG